MTIDQLARRPLSIPIATSWLLADLGEAKGRQDLHSGREPERLRVLRQHALIESAISSNRIEGVVVEQARVEQVVLGRSHLTNRDEEEVRGYREALSWIHENHASIRISAETILRLHWLSHGKTGDARQFKLKDSDIIERHPDGRLRVRFKTVPAKETPARVDEFVSLWEDCRREQWAPPLITLAAANLDFLCIHPFRDGNGRVSRLLLLLMAYHFGFEVGRYISIERLIEQNKERYYETLGLSSAGWHEGLNDPWHYANFVLTTLKSAYGEFEQRLAEVASPRGAKSALVEAAVRAKTGAFTLAALERECPGVSRDLIRRVLGELRKKGVAVAVGRGPGAEWQRKS
jgi:Fic family protein